MWPLFDTGGSLTELYTGDCTDVFNWELNIGQKEVSKSIHQRCTGSPEQFVMIGNIIRDNTRKGIEIKPLHTSSFLCWRWTTDGKHAETGRTMLDVVRGAVAKRGLEINRIKSTTCMILNYRRPTIEQLRGMEVEEQLKYLGVTVSSKRTVSFNIKKRKSCKQEKWQTWHIS